MSEKRFTYTVDDRGFYTINDNVTGEKAVMVNDFLKWLNGLNDENEQLREQNNKYVIMMNNNAHLNEMLKEENEQLRQINEDKNGYNEISCPVCKSKLMYSRQVAYVNGEVYFEFDCTNCDFVGRIRKGNLYE